LSAGIPLPERELVHGYINISGKGMSKTLGNVIDPADLLRTYGTEAVRYFILRGVSPVRDADFSDVEHFHDQLRGRYNSDLANDLGNLLNRTVSMITRYRDGAVPEAGQAGELEHAIHQKAVGLRGEIETCMDAYDPQSALAAIWGLVSISNRYAEQTAPWSLANQAADGDGGADARLSTVLYTMAESVRLIGAALHIFLPNTSARILRQLGARASGEWKDQLDWGSTEAGARVSKPEPMFPKLEAPVSNA
ncbi:MAG: class I tRNA ligase family protein, partial [Chloroflexota bacterium]